ncbi:MAG: 23S rRNA (adenine(2503)-C(2))-methyltransferase RlmN [Cytophagaceae bacterium]|nr:23S rRNA (adenine(2503)-C(2))-methyltransferase RlmN [Cytophagaceae bacterium]MBK9932740.1 23S rRNA (adenine(2503)-C(2))-methyltransferase RlmN [Cytophagaceae bacterium]MBL0303570.1 23S rRNA (adenine(2503)-C(2))-methyltransferase RlmN [Cytophagaceae bacterium]MBL0326398.1 23S rRNA (adenine(2503)-C(2))-methyltransferase RlmN [Cytophagaceae bacterium]
MKADLRKLTKQELEGWLKEKNEPKFRAKQIMEWLWQKSVTEISAMTNLSQKLREMMSEEFEIRPVTTYKSQFSSDGTIKSGFKLYDKNLVEGVLIPTDTRMTACISSQVGCSLTCKFCATGYMKRERNLDAAEIYDQVILIKNQAQEHFNAPLTNIVYMGMGEPLLNYEAMIQSVNYITSPDGLNWSPKRITVSTAGIAKMIKKLGDDEVKFNLALSLHAANDEKRNQIMPINESNSLKNLAEALNYFYKKTGNIITFEYIVFNGFNDSLDDANDLLKFWKKVPAKVNIIEYNPISEADFKNAEKDKIEEFAAFLEKNRVNVHIRRSRGKDIDAACGQLAIKET